MPSRKKKRRSLTEIKDVYSSTGCPVCVHSYRRFIEKRLLEGEDLDKIAKRYKGIDINSLFLHWDKHMKLSIQHATAKMIEDAAVELKDSLEGVTSIIGDVEKMRKALMEKIIAEENPMELSRLINSYRGLAGVEITAYKLNEQLKKDVDLSGRTEEEIEKLFSAMKGEE